MILLPGEMSKREERRSELSFHWTAADCSLRALTGQEGVLSPLTFTTVGGPMDSLMGPSLTAGRGQPRFSRLGSENVLDLSGVTTGQDQERLLFPYALHLHDLTMWLKMTPRWAAGGSIPAAQYVLSLGGSGADGGRIRITRGGALAGTEDNWGAYRERPGLTSAVNTLNEPATLTWPVELKVTFTRATEVVSIQLRGANGITSSTTSTGSGAQQSGRFAGDVLAMGSDAELGLGVDARFHEMKIALGLYSFDAMAALK